MATSSSNTAVQMRAKVDGIYRSESRRVFATLIRLLGDFDLAEEAMHDAFTYSLGQIVAYAARLGTIGFGGPVALVGYMHRDLVERRRWFSEADYKESVRA